MGVHRAHYRVVCVAGGGGGVSKGESNNKVHSVRHYETRSFRSTVAAQPVCPHVQSLREDADSRTFQRQLPVVMINHQLGKLVDVLQQE